MTPEDTVVEASQRLTEAVTANYKGAASEQMLSLKQLEKVFNQIEEKNAQEVADKQLKNNDIKTYNKDPQPRVAVPQPSMGFIVTEQVEEPQFIVAFPTEAVVNSLKWPLSNYISQDEEEAPAQNNRLRKNIQRTITQ